MGKPSNQDARLRMDARAKVFDPSRPPRFDVHFVDDPQPDGMEGLLPGFAVCESWEAVARGGGLPEQTYERHQDESQAEFETRVHADQPVNGLPRMVIFFPKKDSPEGAD